MARKKLSEIPRPKKETADLGEFPELAELEDEDMEMGEEGEDELLAEDMEMEEGDEELEGMDLSEATDEDLLAELEARGLAPEAEGEAEDEEEMLEEEEEELA